LSEIRDTWEGELAVCDMLDLEGKLGARSFKESCDALRLAIREREDKKANEK